MKLVSTQTEITVLRNLCSRDLAVSGTLLAGVDESYFHNGFVKEAFERIQAHTRKNGELPNWRDLCEDPALSEKVRSKLKEIKVGKISNLREAEHSLSRLNEYRQLRGIFDLNETAVTLLRAKKADPSSILDKMSNEIVRLRQQRSVENDVLVFGKGNNSSQFIKEMMEAETMDYIPTGFRTFDQENQGFGWGNLVLVAGSTGGGKSTLAAQFGINWMQMGEDVTFVPLEMSKKEMAARVMANASDIDVRKILFGKMSENEKLKYWKAYKKFVLRGKKQGGTFRVFKPKSDMTIEEIMASTYPFGSRIIIIDYISLLKDVDGDDAWQKLGAVARYCKVYAETHNKIVVLLAQLSEEGQVRYARSLLEHSNYAWKFVATASTREQEIINIEQGKARNGRMFDFTLKATMATMRVRDLDESEREDLDDKKNKKVTKDSKGGKGNKFRKDAKGKRDADDEKPAKSRPSKSYMQDLADDDDD